MEERLARLEEAIGQIVEAVRMVCEKQAAMDEEIDRLLQNKVLDRLDGIETEFGSMVGGLNDIIDGRRRREYSEGLREKHPEFGRYEVIGKDLGLDVYGIISDHTFGLTDEEREESLSAMLEDLKIRLDKYLIALESHNAHEASETPADEKAEHVEDKEESPERVDPILLEMARKFRSRDK